MRRLFNEPESRKGENLIVFGSGDHKVIFDFQTPPKSLLNGFGGLEVSGKHLIGADIEKIISRLKIMAKSDQHGNVSKKVLSRLESSPSNKKYQLGAARELHRVGKNRKSLEEREIQNFYFEIQNVNTKRNLGISDDAIFTAIVFRYGGTFKGWASVAQIRKKANFMEVCRKRKEVIVASTILAPSIYEFIKSQIRKI